MVESALPSLEWPLETRIPSPAGLAMYTKGRIEGREMTSINEYPGWISTHNTTGDWFTLAEAAKLFSDSLGITKTVKDVLKAGYINYFNGPSQLSIFAAVDTPLILSSSHYNVNISNYFVHVGQAFQLHPTAVEALLLRGRISSNHPALALRPMISYEKIEDCRVVSDSFMAPHWVHNFEGVAITEAITIDIDDICIDHEDLYCYIEKLKKIKEKNLSNNVLPLSSDVQIASTKENESLSWIAVAKEIGVKIKKENSKLTNQKIAQKVHEKMTEGEKKNMQNMTGRGGKVPSVATILRQAGPFE